MTPIKIVNKLRNLINEMAEERLNLTTNATEVKGVYDMYIYIIYVFV